jgi:hypothetical protein
MAGIIGRDMIWPVVYRCSYYSFIIPNNMLWGPPPPAVSCINTDIEIEFGSITNNTPETASTTSMKYLVNIIFIIIQHQHCSYILYNNNNNNNNDGTKEANTKPNLQVVMAGGGYKLGGGDVVTTTTTSSNQYYFYKDWTNNIVTSR